MMHEAKIPGVACGRVGRPIHRRESRLRPNLDTNQRARSDLESRRFFSGWKQGRGGGIRQG